MASNSKNIAELLNGDVTVTATDIADGSVTAAKIADGEVTNAKIASGISSSKLSGALPAVDGSSLTGISSKINTNMASYVRYFGASVNGDNVTADTWYHVPLNVEKVNNISASISSSVITLPAGTYYFSGACATYKCNRNGARIYDDTNSQTIVTGGGSHSTNNNQSGGWAIVEGTATLTGSTDIKFEVWVDAAGTMGLFPASGESWQQSYLNIWEIS